MAERRSVIQIFTVLPVYLRFTVRVTFMPRKIRALLAPCKIFFYYIGMNLLMIGIPVFNDNQEKAIVYT
jgi:hypothetical protein